MPEPHKTEVEEDGQFHSYTTKRIPWYVRAMWIIFWIGAIWYIIRFLVPSVKNYM